MKADKFLGKRLSPLQAIRAFCLWCGGSALDVRMCPGSACAFFTYRMGAIPDGASRSLVRAIKARCQDCKPEGAADCDAYQTYEIHQPCPCWSFRMGRNPNIGQDVREKRRELGKRSGFKPGPRPETALRNVPDARADG